MVAIANYGRFISKISANRQPSLIRELTKVLATAPPEMIPLSGGFPNPATFPFSKITVETLDGKTINMEGSLLRSALQYLPTQGYPPLVSWLKDLQKQIHQPAPNTELVVTTGSQDGLCKALEMLMEPGEPVVVEDFVYAGTLAIMDPYKPDYRIVPGDSKGMRPDALRDVLSSGDSSTKPKFIYINPTGANPTGTVLTEGRRKEIYQLASEHDMLILEDDPYYYLQFLHGNRPPSFLSLDTEGRVLRFDSFSKVLSSGLRLGFVSGPPQLVERIQLHMQCSVLHASSMSQVIAHELLKMWGIEGFMDHVTSIEAFYQRRRDIMIEAAHKHLTGLADFSVPDGGMFLWMQAPNVIDTWDMLLKRGLSKNIMLLPGHAFMPKNASESPKAINHMRAAFSVASEKDFDVAFERLAELIREEQANQKQ